MSSARKNRHMPKKGKGKPASKAIARKEDMFYAGVDPPQLETRDMLSRKLYTIQSQCVTSVPVFSQTATAPNFAAYYFILSQLDNASAYTTLYDQYRVDWIEWVCRPMYTSNALSPATNIVPQIYSVIDYDDANVTSYSINIMRSYESCAIRELESFGRKIKPHVAIAAYSGAFTSFENVESPWIDSASPNVQHYGMKLGVDPGATGQTNLQSWNVSCRVQCSFRNVR